MLKRYCCGTWPLRRSSLDRPAQYLHLGASGNELYQKVAGRRLSYLANSPGVGRIGQPADQFELSR